MVVPEGWEKKKLNQLVDMKSGLSITERLINDFDPYPCYGGNGLRGYTASYTHQGNFALIGRQGALCGNVAFVSGRFFASEHAIVVTPFQNTDIKYIYYIPDDMKLNQYSESSAQPGLSVAKILELSHLVPSDKTKQTAIAEAFSDVDSLIASLEKLIAKKKAIKQGAMQELLTGQKRLPGFSGEWVILPLVRIFEIKKDKIDSHNSKAVKCIELEHIETESGRLLGWTDLKKQQSLKNVFRAGDVLYGRLRPYLKKYHYPLFDGVCSTEIWVLSGISGIAINIYIYYMIQCDWFTNVANSTTGTKMPRADWSLLKDMIASIPSDLAEQRDIASILSDMDVEIEQLEKKLVKYRLIKQGMMQELLTGRIRLV